MGRRCLLATLALVVALGSIPLARGGAQTTQGTSGAKQLAAPDKLWAAQVSPSEVTLSWGAVVGALGYEVFMRDEKGSLVKLGETSASGRRYVVPITRLSGMASQVIEFAVRAIGNGRLGGVLGSFNPVSVAKADAGKGAAAPTNVRAVESAPGVVTLTWNEVDGATAYAIGRASGTSGFQRLCDICPVGGRYVDSVRTAGVRYVYRIAALTPNGTTRGTFSDSVVTGSVSFAGTGGGATPTTAADTDLKGLADKASLTVRRTQMDGILHVFGTIGRASGVVVRLMRQVCNGPLQEVRRIADNAPFQLDDRLGGLDFPECRLLNDRVVRYVLRFTDPKGLTIESKDATITLPQGVATTGDSTAGPPADPKGHAEGVSITANPLLGAPQVVRVLVQLATPLAQGLRAELVRQVCNGPLQVVDEILDHAQSQFDDRIVVLGIPDCNGSGKLAVRYHVRFSDAKGLAANSKTASVELPAEVATTGGTPPDPKALAEGVRITATPRVGGPRIIRIAVQMATPIVQGVTAELVRQVCGGQLYPIRAIVDNAPFQIEDALEGIGFPECGSSAKMLVSYTVRFRDPKGLVANSKATVVELAKENVATAPPATPANRRIARHSNGSRILTWDAVEGATSYRLERVVGAKGAWTLLREVSGSTTSFTDAARVSEPPRYRITAVNSAGASAAGVFP